MPREFTRKDRVSDALQRELAELIREEVRDPRLALVNITAVEANRDLAHAKVYVTFVGTTSEEEGAQATEVLNGAAGFFRSTIAKRHAMRTTPKPRFHYDKLVESGPRLEKLIDTAMQQDAANSTDDNLDKNAPDAMRDLS